MEEFITQKTAKEVITDRINNKRLREWQNKVEKFLSSQQRAALQNQKQHIEADVQDVDFAE